MFTQSIQLRPELIIQVCIFYTNRMGAFEHHVFKQMGNAGDTGTLVGGTDMGNPAGGDHRCTRALYHQKAHTIVQAMLADDVPQTFLLGRAGQAGGEQDDQ